MSHWRRIKCIPTKRKVGNVWLVSHAHDRKKIGYFKFPTPLSKQYNGNVVANEYIAYKLGEAIGLPVAKTELATLDGKNGIVSIRMNKGPLYNWDNLKRHHSNVFKQVINPQRLIKMLIFDIWILNIDRNNQNIVLYSADTPTKYDFYLIDHGLSLHGSFHWKKVNWRSSYWDDVTRYNNRYLSGLLDYIRENKGLLPMYIDEINTLPNKEIKKILEEVPENLLSHQEKRILYTFLIKRKDRLEDIVTRFVNKLS